MFYFILNGSFTLASFFIFIIYKDRVVNILPYFAKIKEILQTSNVTAEELFEVIEGSKFKKEKFGKKEVELSGDIVLKDVVFSYTKDEVNVLDGLSLTLNPGINALVGASGAGKSTILNLINKTYNINSGSIETGGYNIKTLSKDSLRGSISVVSQEPYLFNLTIKENLRLVDPKISDEDIIEVCKKCRLHNDISMMEKGYDSLLGENGVRLSVGQKQRLAIARAFIKGSKIILMDEPTSALDNKNQHQITMAINEIVKDSGATVVIVAHRLSTIKDANNIIVLDNGKVDSVGNHDSLLKKSLIYQSLYNEEANLN
jgi:ATP-binding cassette subfamily B protein